MLAPRLTASQAHHLTRGWRPVPWYRSRCWRIRRALDRVHPRAVDVGSGQQVSQPCPCVPVHSHSSSRPCPGRTLATAALLVALLTPGPYVCSCHSRWSRSTTATAAHGLVALCQARAVLVGLVHGLHELAGAWERPEEAGASLWAMITHGPSLLWHACLKLYLRRVLMCVVGQDSGS